MTEPLAEIDLDALAPKPKRVKLGGKWYRLPGDMPMGLFVRVQGYEQRIDAGEDEAGLLTELQSELLALFQVNQPTMKKLPEIGVLSLMGALGAIYASGEAAPAAPANRAQTRQAKRKTPSKPSRRRPAT